MQAVERNGGNFEENLDVAARDGINLTPPPAKKESILDLPDDIKKNMVGYAEMEMDTLVMQIIGSHNSPVNVDRIILVLWYKHQKKFDRMKLIRRLRIMCDAGHVKKIAGTRGNYLLTEAGYQIIG